MSFDVSAAPVLEAARAELVSWGLEEPARFLSALAERFPEPRTAESLAQVQVTELWLVTACVAKDARAFEIFDRRFLVPAVRHVCLRHAHLECNDLAQAVRERLLVGVDLHRLRSWRGRGPLAAWLRSVTTRVALNARPTRTMESLDDDGWGEVLRRLEAPSNPELTLLNESLKVQLRAALRESLRRLPQREKLALRLHVFEGLSTEQLGRIFQVNPATARRWIQGARETVLDNVRAMLANTSKWSPSQVDSALRGLGSSLDLGLSGLGS